MKFVMLFMTLVCSLVQVAASQVPPPPPLIYSAPSVEEISEFKDAENKFKAAFPGKPEKKFDRWEKMSFVNYKVYRKGSNSSITVTNFPDEWPLRAGEQYDAYRDRLGIITERELKSGQSSAWKITFDREITIDGVQGREFGYETDFNFIHTAVFLRGRQLFEVKSDVTNWHILKNYNPEIATAFTAEAKRFIKSFGFLQ